MSYAVRATQVAVFVRRQQGKIKGKTGCAERDELSDGRLRESDFPVRDRYGAGATTGRGPRARRLMVQTGNAKPASDVLAGAVQRRGRTSGSQPAGPDHPRRGVSVQTCTICE